MARRAMGDVIILLPGIMGSVLQVDGKDVWAPSPGALMKALWTLGNSVKGLKPGEDDWEKDDLGDGVTAPRLVPDIHGIPGVWGGIDGYTKVSEYIQLKFDVVPGKTFIPFPYDWRRDNRVAARKLAAVAAEALHEQRKVNREAKLILIGHSMGGLVARWYLEILGGWRDTRVLITFGTPYRGSLNSVDYLANGFAKKVGPLKLLDLSDFVRSLTSIYQLLPIYPCIREEEGGGLVRAADSKKVAKLVAAQVPSPKGDEAERHLARAHSAEHDFHRAIEKAVNTREREFPYVILPIIGVTQPTLQLGTIEPKRLRMDTQYPGEEFAGDGTVPQVSASPIELDQHLNETAVYLPEGHGSLQNAPSSLTQILGQLSPLKRDARFRAVGNGLALTIDDIFSMDEGVMVNVTADIPYLDLKARVVDLATGKRVGSSVNLTSVGDVSFSAELPPLPAGDYRLQVAPWGDSAGLADPVHGLFHVASDAEPDQ